MNCVLTATNTVTLSDGLGVRRLDVLDGRPVELLDVAPALARDPAFEAAVRARAARFSELAPDGVAEVRRIDRDGASLCVVADHIDGVRLADLLRVPGLAVPASLELTAQIIRAVAALHQKPGLAHGAIMPAHVVVTGGGAVRLTDCAFGGALESLRRNREQLWRDFSVAIPSSASLPRFDARSDVTELGVTVLAVMLGRLLTADEYPRPVADLVNIATAANEPGKPATTASRMRMWLHQSLQLHPRENFRTAVEAERAFAGIIGASGNRRARMSALQAAVQGQMNPSHFRTVFPNLGAN